MHPPMCIGTESLVGDWRGGWGVDACKESYTVGKVCDMSLPQV